MDKQLQRKLERLARDQCANWLNGKCLLTGRACTFSTVHGSPTCVYMQQSVLPAHEVLEKEYYRTYGVRSSEEVKGCERCGTPFIKRGNAHKLCTDCSTEKVRQSKRESERKRRAKRGINDAENPSDDAGSACS